MAIIKCKMCGGDLALAQDSKVAECKYCGTVQTVPSADNEKKLTLFARANRLRSACEFDKASGVYEAIVAEFPEEAEAYWGLVLCKYGIEYVDDPDTGKKVPTCHRSSFDSVMDDTNFEQALENADVLARKIYREEAKQIENIRKGIIEVSFKEAPYDIFICYKEMDVNGYRTLDSVLAQDIYDALIDKGYRVFFSRITLEDKLGQEYEPYIFAALDSAKIMLAVGTDYEHYNAVWVKNEWSRFLHMISVGQKKTLIPCYKNIDAYDMPKEFAKLQAQDLGKVGALQDLMRGIEKIMPRQTSLISENWHRRDNVVALIKRAYMALADGEWSSADRFFEEVLNQDAECGEAYFGKYLTSEKYHNMQHFLEARLQIEPTEGEIVEACPRDLQTEQMAIDKYAIPGYLGSGVIQRLFDFSRTYSSKARALEKHLLNEHQFFEENRYLSRAAQYASGDFDIKFQQFQELLFKQIEKKIEIATEVEVVECENIKKAYQENTIRVLKEVAARHETALRIIEENYINACSMRKHALSANDFQKAANAFDKLRGYKDSEELSIKCRNEADQIKRNKERMLSLQREIEEKKHELQKMPWISGTRKRKIQAEIELLAAELNSMKK